MNIHHLSFAVCAVVLARGVQAGTLVIAENSLDDIHARARGCPILTDGGSIEIAEIMEM